MARTTTVGDIRTMVRLRADMDGDFVTDAEFITLINSAYTELYDILVRAGLYPAEATATITATGGSTIAYNLPSDFYGVIAVSRLENGKYFSMEECQAAERNRYRNSAGTRALAYRLCRSSAGVDQIELLPAPASGQQFEVLYVPAPASLTSAATSIDGVSGWEELITAIVARRVRVREEASTAELDAEIDMLMARVEEMAENRRAATTLSIARVRDTRLHDDTGRLVDDELDWYW